jgi:hypothetical protein
MCNLMANAECAHLAIIWNFACKSLQIGGNSGEMDAGLKNLNSEFHCQFFSFFFFQSLVSIQDAGLH